MAHQNNPSAVNGRSRPSSKLVLSYALDWAVIIGAVLLGIIFSNMVPNKRPFSLGNPEISFPFQNHEKVPAKMLGIYAMTIPAIIICIVSLVFIPGPVIPKSVPPAKVWSLRLWEWHTGWLGLGLSLSSAFLITCGMKNLFGKPRPDLLARCIPDLSNLERFKVGGFFGTEVVSADICLQTDMSVLNDGFRSYPSGHSSFAAGGLVYLSLFLASKLIISIPHLSPKILPGYTNNRNAAFHTMLNKIDGKKEDLSVGADNRKVNGLSDHNNFINGIRNEAAAPPIYLMVFAVIPFFTSIYIASTRYADFRHHGFDILFGYMIGTISAFFSFRLYHLPISRGEGWAWGPRSPHRSFWSGVGVGTYAGTANHWRDKDMLKSNMEDQLGDIENSVGTGPSLVSSNPYQNLILVSRLLIKVIGSNGASSYATSV